MKLITIHLVKYNRLNLNKQLRTCSLSPTNEVIIIGGDNGSGKSSICITFFPWPINKTDIDEGGSVTRTWEHNGSIYVDSYVDNVYSFTKDDIELNQQGGLRLQESLFTEHFAVDAAVMRVLTVEHRFTSMSVKQRQYWMSRLDRHQLEKLEIVIKRLKDLKREKEILLTYNNTQLGKYMVTDDVSELETECKRLTSDLDALMSTRYNVTQCRTVSTITTELRNVRIQLVLYKKKTRELVRYVTWKDRQSILDRRVMLTTQRQAYTDRLTMLPNQIVQVDGLPSMDECVATINKLSMQLREIDDIFNRPEVHAKWLYMSNEVISNFQTAFSLQSLLNIDVNELQVSASECDMSIRSAKESLGTCLGIISLLESGKHDIVTCPSCNSNFGRYDGIHNYDATVSEVNELNRFIHGKTKELGTIQEKIGQAKLLIDVLEHIWSKISRLDPQYVILVKDRMPSLSACYNTLIEIASQLAISVENSAIQVEIDRFTHYLSIHDAFNVQQQANVASELAVLTNLINETDTEISKVSRILDVLDKYTQAHDKHMYYKGRVKELVSELLVSAEAAMLSEFNRAIGNSALDVRSTLNTVTHKLSMCDANKQHYEEISSTVNSLTSELTTINEALAVLDGKKGFVGAMYKERAEIHVKAMNTLIAKLWDYDLYLSTPPDSMTFRFPLTVEGTRREDVSCGSKGMLEVIDLAFLLLVRAVLHLTYLPLIVDELGGNLDPVHLEKTYGYLMEYPVDQLVVVSHISEIQSLIGEDKADYIMLSDRHVLTSALPSTTNACLTTFC